jgi:5-amino-6-(5-phosphoribosylamino)uracil reductase
VNRPSTRLVLAVSLDGRLAPPQGGAAQIGGPGDRLVLEEALAWSDAALLGAATLRCHGSTCLLRQPQLLADRQAGARPPQPVAIVASRSGLFADGLPFFKQPLRRWLLAPEPVAATARGRGFQRGVPMAGWPASLAVLADLGIARLVVLGGAEIAGELLAAGLLDELQLTLSPQLLGGTHSWLPAGLAMPEGRWRPLERRLLDDGDLLLRYGCPAAGAG